MQRIRQSRPIRLNLTLRSRMVIGYVGVLLLLALFAELSYLQFSRMLQANQELAQASNRSANGGGTVQRRPTAGYVHR